MAQNDDLQKINQRDDLQSEIIAKAWKDDKFKQELLSNPKAVFSREYGIDIPDNVQINVVEENASTVYLVIPVKPSLDDSRELAEEELELVAGGAMNEKTCTSWWTQTTC
jgi:hypothetical protein